MPNEIVGDWQDPSGSGPLYGSERNAVTIRFYREGVTESQVRDYIKQLFPEAQDVEVEVETVTYTSKQPVAA